MRCQRSRPSAAARAWRRMSSAVAGLGAGLSDLTPWVTIGPGGAGSSGGGPELRPRRFSWRGDGWDRWSPCLDGIPPSETHQPGRDSPEFFSPRQSPPGYRIHVGGAAARPREERCPVSDERPPASEPGERAMKKRAPRPHLPCPRHSSSSSSAHPLFRSTVNGRDHPAPHPQRGDRRRARRLPRCRHAHSLNRTEPGPAH
jgi:hypothetical protein